MKLSLLFVFLFCFTLSAQVGIGTVNPSPASMLEVSSSSDNIGFSAFMPPRVTVLQRDKIKAQNTDIGLTVFVKDDAQNINCLQVWNGTNWESVYCLLSSNSPTSVEYTNTSRHIGEGDGAFGFEFNVTNPSSINDLSITITASSYTGLVEKTAMVVNIPAGQAVYNVDNVFNVFDDTLVEGNENITFTITNVSGGSGGATIGRNNKFVLEVVDNDIVLWINEIHYDNNGTDINERVEIAGTAVVDITRYSILHYNGANGKILTTRNILRNIPNQENGLGTLNFSIKDLQNGPDAIALVDPQGKVIQFLSWKGAFTATEGPAKGMASTNLPVSQSGAQPAGTSLQLQGTGNKYSDFTWAAGVPDTIGTINVGQAFN